LIFLNIFYVRTLAQIINYQQQRIRIMNWGQTITRCTTGKWVNCSITFQVGTEGRYGARGDGCVTPCPGCFTYGKDTWYSSYRRLDEPWGHSGWVWEISPHCGSNTILSPFTKLLYQLRSPDPSIIANAEKCKVSSISMI
jgi:hypothetical protein